MHAATNSQPPTTKPPRQPTRLATCRNNWSSSRASCSSSARSTTRLARRTCERLIALAQESDAPIQLLISSPGGHVESGDAIHDVIRFVRAPITTIGTGWVASAGTHIYLAAPKERRVCLPNTRFMIHQPAGGAGGRASDIAIQAREIIKVRERIARVVATPDRPALRQGAGRHGARLLDERRRGRGLRHRQPRHRPPVPN